MSFKAIEILALIPVIVSVIAIIVANRAVTRSLRPVLVFVCEVRDKVWCVQNVGTGPALDVLVAEKDRNEEPWARAIKSSRAASMSSTARTSVAEPALAEVTP